MENCGSMLKRALVIIVLVAVVQSGSAQQKLASCCKKVNKQEIQEPITGYLVQKPNPPCVKAVIFQTKSGLFCSQLNAPWVFRKIQAFEKAKATASSVVPSSTASLLSIITSTASPPSSSPPSSSLPSSSLPSSSTPLPSSSLPTFPSTSEMPETFSGNDE